MGAKESLLSQEQLDEYILLTYLTKSDILYIFGKFKLLGVDLLENDLCYRFQKDWILELYPQLKYNPFSDRMFRVFSSVHDEKLSFEDFLNLCSIMSPQCPLEVKATWAFKMFDYDEDDIITKTDIANIIDCLTMPRKLFPDEKEHVSKILLTQMDLQEKGGMNQLEFVHAISKMPEFSEIFSFRP